MIVMKFGGTSVEDAAAIDRAAQIVCHRLARDPVVVVSAMAKVTDQLVAMGRAAGSGDRDSALQLSRAVRERHYNAASELLGTAVFGQLHGELEADFDSLDDLLRGIAAVGELTPRTIDNVLSFGERLSSKLVTAAFRSRGLSAVLVDSRECIVTDANHNKAAPLMDDTHDNLRARLRPLLEKKRVPVMGGFIAATREGVTTTIGRGGSDFSAAIVGAALDAERIEIWTDVDGMMTTDPEPLSRTRCASSPSASRRRRSWRTSAPKCCIRPRCCPPFRRTSACTCSIRATRRMKAPPSRRARRIAATRSRRSPPRNGSPSWMWWPRACWALTDF